MPEWFPHVPSLQITPWFLIGLVLLGGAVGYASGLFGVGGGFIVTPLLITLFGMKVGYAVGAEVTQMIAVGIVAARRHAAAGFVDMRMGLYMAPTIVGGTVAGKASLDALKDLGEWNIRGQAVDAVTLLVSIIFIVLLSTIGLYLWLAGDEPKKAVEGGPFCWPRGPLPVALPASGIVRCSFISIAGCGLVLGFLAGMLGIGGGVLLVPLLTVGFGVPLRMAIGTGPLLILFSALFSSLNHAVAGNVDMRVVLALLAGSTVGVQLGAWQSHRLRLTHLRRAFAVLVLLVVALLLVRQLAYFLPIGSLLSE